MSDLAMQAESAYGQALEAVASGVSRDETLEFLRNYFPQLEAPVIHAQADAAAADALRQGVQAEDIDPSWLGDDVRPASRKAPCGCEWYGLRPGRPDCGCGWGDLCTQREPEQGDEPLGIDPRLPRA